MNRYRVVEVVTIQKVWEVAAYTKHEAAEAILLSEDQWKSKNGRNLMSDKVVSRQLESVDEFPSDPIR